MNLQIFSQLKTVAGNLTIDFNGLTLNPVVLLSPYWQYSNQTVGSVPTVTMQSTASCAITDLCAADNYYENGIAITPGNGTIGELNYYCGTTSKTESEIAIDFPRNFRLNSDEPVVILTPYWLGSENSVGSIETVVDPDATQLTITSGNISTPTSSYFVNCLAIDRGVASFTDDINNNWLLEANSINKTNAGTYRVYFAANFNQPPVVLLSPWWQNSQNGVGNIETVINVTQDYFEFTSNNYASNYFVDWIAVENVQ